MQYTIERVGEEKTVETKFGPKKKQGVIFKEVPGVWHNIWAGGLQVGQVLEGERVSREYQGKTYWDLQLPKKAEQAVQAVKKEVGDKLEQILNDLTTLKLGQRQIASYLNTNLSRKTSAGTEVPWQQAGEAGEIKIDYPDEISVEDIPFG